jgi:hypothetical protein
MKNAKINKVVKWCLILAAVVMTGSFCFHSDIIYGEVKGDSIKNITGFMQDPKKNYNTKNKVKIGKVNITNFKNRYTTEAEREKYDGNSNYVAENEEKCLGAILDSRIIYADEYLTSDKADAYILKNVKKYDKSKMQFEASSNSFTQAIDTRWNKVSKASGYEIRIKQCYNGNWTDWTYRRTSANHVKLYGLDGGRKLANNAYKLDGEKKIPTAIYNGAVSLHKQKFNFTDKWIDISLSTGCSYKVQVRAYKVVKGKYYYGPWSNTKTANKLSRTPYTLIDKNGSLITATYSMNTLVCEFNYDYRISQDVTKKNPFATQPDGFEVQTADNSAFKNAKSEMYPTTDTTLILNEIPSGSYVRVRTYKNASSQKIVGGWSKTVIAK